MSDLSREKLAELVASLSPQQQTAVTAFIHFLQTKATSAGKGAELQAAIDEFVDEYSELLRRLAQ